MESAAAAAQTKWVLDPSHSELSFKVKHLMISNVKGVFKNFSAVIDGDDFIKAPITVTIESASVFTNDDNRDGHLKSAEFFDVEKYPEIVFKSTSISKVDDEHYTLKGQLTIKGISKEVTLNVEYSGTGKDPWGNEKAAFSVSGKINRTDWGLNWNAALEAGGVLVSEEVRIDADIQLKKG